MEENSQSPIKKINSKVFDSFSIENYKNKDKIAYVIPLSQELIMTADNIKEIVEICNQEAVFELLFREKLNGEKYQEQNAVSFISWANKGWSEESYFVYLIKTSDNKVIGALDIKSNNPESGEIGYWMNSRYPGYMTNALIGLIKKAKIAGYTKLVAYTKLENDKSKQVLNRASFNYVGKEKREMEQIRDKFTLDLN